MPPKKRKNEDNIAPKPKRQKIEDKETSAVDSGFQNPNIDVAKYILDRLKLATKDLKALSETCSSWLVKITSYYREIFAHTLPNTHNTFTRAQKLKAMAEIAQVRKHVSDIQLIELDRGLHEARFEEIPWCKNIVFAFSQRGHWIIDLRKEDPILIDTTDKAVYRWSRRHTMYSINANRKQVLVWQWTQNPQLENACEAANITNNMSYAPADQLLYIYEVSNEGKVDLVRTIDTKAKESSLCAFLQDDGTVWLASAFKVEIFRQDSVETYNYPDKLGRELEGHRNIMGIIEHNGVIKLIVQDLSDSDVPPKIFIYNTKTRQHEKLPIYCDWEYVHIITYRSNSLQFHDSNSDFCGSCTLDPTIQRQIKMHRLVGENVSMSPDGSRIIEYEAEENVLKIDLKDQAPTRTGKNQDYDLVWQTKIHLVEESAEDEAFPVVEQKKKKKKKTAKKKQKIEEPKRLSSASQSFFWLTNDIIIVMWDSKMAILDFRSAPPAEGFKYFELPFTKDRKVWISATGITRLSDDSFVVWLKPYDNTVAYKITV